MAKKCYTILFTIMLFFCQPSFIFASDDLYLGGDSIGIEVDYDGVMISGTYPINVSGQQYDPSTNIHVKDKIISVNGNRVQSINDLSTQLGKFQEDVNKVPIEVIRDDKKQALTLTTVYDSTINGFKSGLYVKDKIVGVGTMTFYDPSTQRYGALGHEIMDVDLKEIAVINKGTIYPAYVQSITRSQKNVPGEKQATIDFTQVLGSVDKNTNIGIYGTYDKLPGNATALPWAKKEQVHEGTAYIYTVLEGNQLQKYEIEITKLHTQDSSDVKGIEFRITDKALLDKTNGIIQGMSGSPIVQDDAIVGAVTHVVTSNPMNGYGVYIEWMLTNTRD